jgi:hypothetical protein
VGTEPAYGFPIDVYAFGMTLYVMFSPSNIVRLEDGTAPRTEADFMRKIGEGRRLQPIPGVPECHWSLIKKCWDQAPNLRPTFAQLLSEFQESHRYVLPGADLAEVMRYEEEIMAPRGEVDEDFNQQLIALLNGTV